MNTPAHDDGAQNSQQQCFSLFSGAEAERTKHQQKNKKIVDAERQLDQVTRGKFKPRLPSFGMANPNPETSSESQQKQDKQKIMACLGRLFPAAQNNQVDQNQNQHYNVKTYPPSNRSAIEHYPMLA